MREGAAVFNAGLDAIPEDLPAAERLRLALPAHLRVVAEQLDVATVFIPSGATSRAAAREIVGERRRNEERLRALVREGAEHRRVSRHPRVGPRRCSSSRPRTGPTPGPRPGVTRTGSPIVRGILVDGIRVLDSSIVCRPGYIGPATTRGTSNGRNTYRLPRPSRSSPPPRGGLHRPTLERHP